jgi:diguanylate cyclase (GGDEF)-like protein
VVFSVRRATLLAAVQGSNEVSWLLFGAFVLAVLALAGLATTAIRGSAQLAGARERERVAHQLAHERLHDALTGLPNRALFLDRAETALARAQRGESSAAVMFSDVDHFKRINDSLGHAAGDELLRMLARRLRDAVRPQDTVSRFGGDEFLVLCDDLRDENDALRIAARVRSALDEPFELSGRSVPLTCCVGIAVHSPTAERIDAATLVRDADAAMYSAKAQGTGRLELFDAALHAEALRRLDSELALRAAIEHDELFVHYQPIVELPGGQLQGVEALARWNRRGEGAVPPTSFIALAEECGLIDELGRKVLETAMSEVREWCNAGLLPESFVLSVNVSPRQLANPGFPHTVAELLKSWPLEPSTLCLEITESAVASDPVITELALSRLAELGVKLALDDFGVGLSSLKQLVRSLPVDVIKLDRSFVADMASSRECSVVAAVAPMARSLGMAAIAEGVERADQAKQLASLGYTLAQGFHFGRPMQAEAIRRTLLHEDLAAA